jgi:hypothetical protein
MSIDTHHHSRARRRRSRGALAGLVAVAVAVTLAACGGSSSKAGSPTNSANTSTQASGQRSGRFAALRACLQKEGITLPSRPSDRTRRPGSGGLGFLGGGGGGGLKAPAGVSQSKFEEALKKCGGGFARGTRRLNGATARAALSKFAQCMRENGVNLPAPNTSGKGPVFNTKGIDTSGSTFKAAETKCRAELRGTFGGGAPPGGASANGAAGAPPSERGGTPPGEGGA